MLAKVASAVKNTQNCHGLVHHRERRDESPFKSKNPQAGSQIVTSRAALGKIRKIEAPSLDAFDIGKGTRRTRMVRYIIV